MIEIGVGLIAIFSGVAIALGLTNGLVPFPLGNSAVITSFVLGAALVLRGLYRLARKRQSGDTHSLRSTGLVATICGVTLVSALALPSLSEPLNAMSIGGFPLGLYAMGQGALIFFVMLLFVYAGWQSSLDDTEEP